MFRTHDGKLQPDQRRFPHGMKALAEYVHKRGLKFGIYGDIGKNYLQAKARARTKSCNDI